MIKKILKDAGRYESVKEIIESITKLDAVGTLPVNAFVCRDGNTKWRVKASVVVKQANNLLESIESGSMETIDDVDELFEYVSSKMKMLLNNYAVSISHRKTPTIDMEIIRSWCILENLLLNLMMETITLIGEEIDWEIPEGWKFIS